MNNEGETLRVYNTLTRRKERFEPLAPGRVTMYVCGVTVYSYCHLGHGRSYVAFDVIYRYLKYLGYQVTYIQNITDLDDKLIKKANEEGGEGDIKARVARIADRYTRAYFEDMKKLSIREADVYPKATEHLPEMQEIIAGLIKKGYAYQRGRNVYFEVNAFKGYGELSRKNLEELQAGVRVKIGVEKKSPLDFVLWKEGAPGDPTWPSPWGEGRPGWHIECSAMSMKELGPSFDIHGGGQDLIFPHHENERAQSEAFTGQPFARYWLHNGFVTINQEKMSKSLGNVFNLRDIFQVFEPRIVRFFLLSQHYRSPVDYCETALQEAKKALFRLDNCLGVAQERWGDIGSCPPDEKAIQAFERAMNDDFNTASALAVAYNLANEFYQQKMGEEIKGKLSAMIKICKVLGIELKSPIHDLGDAGRKIDLSEHPEVIKELLQKKKLTREDIRVLVLGRKNARDQKDWKLADKIRNYLRDQGVRLRDRTGGGTSVLYQPDDLDEGK